MFLFFATFDIARFEYCRIYRENIW